MKLKDFDFDLPRELVAQHPLPRGQARMLHMDAMGNLQDKNFRQIIDFIHPGDVLVMNNSKVVPSSLIGRVGERVVYINIVKQVGERRWQIFARPSKHLNVGKKIIFSDDLYAYVNYKDIESNYIEIDFELSKFELFQKLDVVGQMPLPPYIKRAEQFIADKHNYQTVYAEHEGSFAAPTAGLHFSEEIISCLESKGVKLAFVTLHVWLGTFLPVKSENIDEHIMHEEYFSCTEEAAQIINEAKANHGRIISVGSTSMRVLESIMHEYGAIIKCDGMTSIFIKPGYKFQIVDMMVTNFHLPKSTLFMLVSAFSGLENIQAAYKYAIENKYRVFSYGDACFFERKM
ncbi:S-adenosylmethionine:tRNA ribosyltransferase-isomerase [Candidatus Cyrtobacter comes]|uniref:S-adenosylmethionine:tRNA ribosyltransferase-isomerase n=1 Tax=Candidatus Cyrtobacter comes TaxID=675776 RepID=A0ABU5L854_9RICK|nr:tRNA preQ1(34) S-adenosylmethionine ribosyltransferase-isomerase QueA [Candidatus Cyrtobacter comes]MDZ5762308.1 S-adenosylmethionine:tRNA ribosyltransferase-isomerase [Candidatus Cyrtobacter comes]